MLKLCAHCQKWQPPVKAFTRGKGVCLKFHTSLLGTRTACLYFEEKERGQ